MPFNRIVTYDLEMIARSDNQEVGEIIEIAACLLNLDNGQITNTYSTLVTPNEPIDRLTTDITGITQKMVDTVGVPLNIAIKRLRKKISLEANPWFAWGEDIRTINREFSKKGIKFNVANFHNLATYTRIINRSNNKIGLSQACDIYGVMQEHIKHRALPDAVTTANLAYKILKANTQKK